MNDAAIDKFVESWGAMGSIWGVNTSVARVHGLLIATESAWGLDEISSRLKISKSNVSMSLKELRTWGVIKKVLQPGDRKEYYSCEPDAWKMLFSIIRERKRREFDPIVRSVKDALDEAKRDESGLAVERLKQMEQMLDTFEGLAARLLASETQARALISFFLGK